MPENAQVRKDSDRRQFLEKLVQNLWSSAVGFSIKPSVILPTLAN